MAGRVSITDAETALAYLLSVVEADIAAVATRDVAATQGYALGHRDGEEQALHRLRRECQHAQAMVEAIARGTVIPLAPVGVPS